MSKPKTLGARVRALRKEQRLTQAALGSAVGVSGNTIWRIEADQVPNPRLDTMRGLAVRFGKSVEWLRTGKN